MDESCVYGLTTKARCISPQFSDSQNVRFFVGTMCLREENEVHLIEVLEDHNEIRCLCIYPHPHEIWNLAPCPADSSLFFTVYNTKNSFNCSLWKANDNQTLEEICQLSGHEGQIKKVFWNPSENTRSESVVSLDENHIRIWKLDQPSARVCYRCEFSNLKKKVADKSDHHKLTTGCWNPLHSEQIATANDSSVRGWDLRTMKETYTISQAHTFVRDLDFNPNRDYFMVTAGDDCKIKFWDTRKVSHPVKTFSGHSHWVYNVQYNPFHDQLVLSSGTDAIVNLWNIPSISSAPLDSDSAPTKLVEDKLVKTFEEHEDSVYSVCWGSSSNAWTFASLSYDGRVVVNSVPKSIRNTIHGI